MNTEAAILNILVFPYHNVVENQILFFLQRIHLDIQVGEHTNDYKEIATKDKLTELQLRIRQLLDQVEQISKEQNYQRVGYIVLLCSVLNNTLTKYDLKTFFAVLCNLHLPY